MDRVTFIADKQLLYEVSFETVIRSHHVYRARWTPTTNDKLFGKEDKRANAKNYDQFCSWNI